MPTIDFTGAEHKLATFTATVTARVSDHVVATIHEDLETSLVSANALFDEISDVDTRWHSEVFDGAIPYDETGLERLTALYRDWAETGKVLLALLEQHPEGRVDVASMDLLRANLNEVRGILTPDDEFFNDPALFARQQEALDVFDRGETVEFEEMGD